MPGKKTLKHFVRSTLRSIMFYASGGQGALFEKYCPLDPRKNFLLITQLTRIIDHFENVWGQRLGSGNFFLLKKKDSSSS